MRKLTVIILSFCIIAMPLFNSKYMFSLERGNVVVEEFCLLHFLQYKCIDFINPTSEHDNSFTQNKHSGYSHHVILRNFLAENEFDTIIDTTEQTINTTNHFSKSWNSSLAANSSPYHSRHKSPPLISSILHQTSILLI